MTGDPRFLSTVEVLRLHDLEILAAGGSSGLRDIKALESAVGAPQASFNGNFLMDVFEMAATYLNSIVFNHPFIDGNKRTGLAASLTFLYINGFEITESYDEELADKTIDLIEKKISKSDIVEYFRTHSIEMQ